MAELKTRQRSCVGFEFSARLDVRYDPPPQLLKPTVQQLENEFAAEVSILNHLKALLAASGAVFLSGCAQSVVRGGACGLDARPISAIQGAAARSDLTAQTVLVRGVVSAHLSAADMGYAGYFIEALSAERDSNALTSEGLFVDAPGATVPAVGTLVALNGEVVEQSNGASLLTSIKPTQSTECGSAKLPPLVVLKAPPISWEALEGMRVRIEPAVSLSGNDELARFGALRLSFGERLWIPTQLETPGANARDAAERNAKRGFSLDDLSLAENPVAPNWLGRSVTITLPLRAGDQVSAIEGVLDDRFGYRIRATSTVRLIEKNPRPRTPPNVEGRLKVASFNVLNFFNGDGAGSGFPTTRGASKVAAFERQKSKILSALVALNADAYGLMEIENDGFGPESAIAELTLALNQRLGADSYDFARLGGPRVGSDQITNAIIYKKSVLKPIGGALAQVNGPFQTGSRPPLLQAFEEISSGEKFTLVVNHFKSKGGCPEAKRPEDQDLRDGQACYNAARVDAANALIEGLQTNPVGIDDPDMLLIGDFNAYAREAPLEALKQGGFLNLDGYSGKPDYSYVFQGEAGSLDHALVSETMSGQVAGHAVWHINADEPSLFEYPDQYKEQRLGSDWFAPDAYRSSDHDPLLIGVNLSSDPILM